MENQPESSSATTQKLETLIRTLRFALICILLGISYLNIRACAAVPHIRQFASDMLNEAAFSTITRIVFQWSGVFKATSWLFPPAAISLLFTRPNARSIYAVGLITITTITQIIVVCTAISLLFTTIDHLGSVPNN